MIEFKYRMKPELQSMVEDTIVNYDEDFLYGLLDEGDLGQLKHKSLFLICEQKIVSGQIINIDPMAIVAKNTFDAVEMYCTQTGKEIACSIAEIETRCDNLKVESL